MKGWINSTACTPTPSPTKSPCRSQVPTTPIRFGATSSSTPKVVLAVLWKATKINRRLACYVIMTIIYFGTVGDLKITEDQKRETLPPSPSHVNDVMLWTNTTAQSSRLLLVSARNTTTVTASATSSCNFTTSIATPGAIVIQKQLQAQPERTNNDITDNDAAQNAEPAKTRTTSQIITSTSNHQGNASTNVNLINNVGAVVSTCTSITSGYSDFLQMKMIQYRKLSDLVSLMKATTSNAPPSHAICEYIKDPAVPWTTHFPHAMQQLYRCWSWWQHSASLSSKDNTARMTQRILTGPGLPSPIEWANRPKGSIFLTDFLNALQGSSANVALADNTATIDDMNVIRVTPRIPKDLILTPLFKDGQQLPPFTLHSPRDAQSLTTTLRQFYNMEPVPSGCPTMGTGTTTTGPRPPRIAILNRHEKEWRRLLNAKALVERLKQEIPGVTDIPIVSFRYTTLAFQLDFFGQVDILISAHGAQLTGIPFMPPHGAIFEVFPLGFVAPNYFASLAYASGLNHGYMYATNGDVEREVQKSNIVLNARKQNLCPPLDTMVTGVKKLIVQWHSSCARGGSEVPYPEWAPTANENDTSLSLASLSIVNHTVNHEDSFDERPSGNCKLMPYSGFFQLQIPQHRDLRYFLRRSGMSNDTSPDATTTTTISKTEQKRGYAVCEYTKDPNITHTDHFPHAMQQLYRCWSWWQANPDKHWALVFPPKPLEWKNRDWGKRESPFLTDFLTILREEFQVTIFDNKRPDLEGAHRASPILPIGLMLHPFLNDSRYTDYALHSPRDAMTLAKGVRRFYNISARPSSCPELRPNENNQTAAMAVPRIAILNRGERSFRMIENVDALKKRLIREIPGLSEIPVVEFESKTLEFQVQFLSNVDILISGHGAQLAGLPFMPHRGAVLEIFPGGYYAPHYFASLAYASGLNHGFLYKTQGDLHRELTWSQMKLPSRRQQLCPPTSTVVEGVKRLIEQWRHSCAVRGGNDDEDDVHFEYPYPAVAPRVTNLWNYNNTAPVRIYSPHRVKDFVTYVGCFNETIDGVKPLGHISNSQHSIESCLKYCGSKKFQYAGLQWTNLCSCGNQYYAHGEVPDAACDMGCSLGEGFCGGSNKLSVYKREKKRRRKKRKRPTHVAPMTHQ